MSFPRILVVFRNIEIVTFLLLVVLREIYRDRFTVMVSIIFLCVADEGGNNMIVADDCREIFYFVNNIITVNKLLSMLPKIYTS